MSCVLIMKGVLVFRVRLRGLGFRVWILSQYKVDSILLGLEEGYNYPNTFFEVLGPYCSANMLDRRPSKLIKMHMTFADVGGDCCFRGSPNFLIPHGAACTLMGYRGHALQEGFRLWGLRFGVWGLGWVDLKSEVELHVMAAIQEVQ